MKMVNLIITHIL